jgi:septum formation topological specificity factor MinE
MTAQVAATGAGGSTRSVARERLSVILASQRGSELLQGVDMKALQQDVLKVVQVSKYVS